jgi:hypothetical protein
MPHISDVAWADRLSLIECKSTEIPFSEGTGAGQAISKEVSLSFSAIINWLKIQFFIFKKGSSVSKLQSSICLLGY